MLGYRSRWLQWLDVTRGIECESRSHKAGALLLEAVEHCQVQIFAYATDIESRREPRYRTEVCGRTATCIGLLVAAYKIT